MNPVRNFNVPFRFTADFSNIQSVVVPWLLHQIYNLSLYHGYYIKHTICGYTVVITLDIQSVDMCGYYIKHKYNVAFP